jgi:hypothetical protein
LTLLAPFTSAYVFAAILWLGRYDGRCGDWISAGFGRTYPCAGFLDQVRGQDRLVEAFAAWAEMEALSEQRHANLGKSGRAEGEIRREDAEMTTTPSNMDE